MRPNTFLGVSDGSAQYRKWYYELIVDQVQPFVTAEATHLRVGWANTNGFAPFPSGGEGWGGNGVGDDLYSYGFDGLYLWSGEVHVLNKLGRLKIVVPPPHPPHCQYHFDVTTYTYFNL